MNRDKQIERGRKGDRQTDRLTDRQREIGSRSILSVAWKGDWMVGFLEEFIELGSSYGSVQSLRKNTLILSVDSCIPRL